MLHHRRAWPRVWSANISVQAGPSHAFTFEKSSSQTNFASASPTGSSSAQGSVVMMSGNSALFPKAPYAAVGTINAAIVALAKAFSDRGIADGVQVNSVLPGPVMTGRRRSYLAHWAPLHNMTVEEATAKFPQEAGIGRYGEPEEIAELMAFLVSPGARWMTGSTLRMDGDEVKSI